METETSREIHTATRDSNARQENGRTTKLRASCDNCAHAKVRCGRDHPSCQRCLYVNIRCNYSASRRMGRTSKSGRSGDNITGSKRSVKEHRKSESCCTDTTSESSDSPNNITQQLPDVGLDSCPQDFDYVALQPWNCVSDLPASPSFASLSDAQANASNLAQPHMTATHFQATISKPVELSFAAPFPNNTNLDTDCMRIEAQQSVFQQLSPDLVTSPYDMPHQASSIAHQNRTCVELASETIHSLSLPSSMCASSPHLIAFHTVEQILATSRSAMSAFYKILHCPCSHSRSFTLTLALTISRILDCYTAICRLPTSSAGNTCREAPSCSRDLLTPSSSSTSLITPSPTCSAPASISQRSPHNIVMDTPIAIGGYNIDPDDEYTFILQLVLSELRKVSKLVDAFAVQSSTANAVSGRSNGAEDPIYQSLEHFLRCQVHMARREVDAMLRGSEEGP